MKIYLIRHGEMAGDPFITPEQPVTGSLSEVKGIPQAKQLAEAVKKIKIDKAFSSPFGRALQTAEIALKDRNIPINILPYMYEWMPNRSLDKIPSTEFEEIHKKWGNAYPEETWKTDLGEGTFDMYARICPPFLTTLATLGVHARHGGYVLDKPAEDLSIAVFAHGGSLNTLLSFLLDIRPFPVGKFSFTLTGVAEINFTERKGVYYPELVIPTL